MMYRNNHYLTLETPKSASFARWKSEVSKMLLGLTSLSYTGSDHGPFDVVRACVVRACLFVSGVCVYVHLCACEQDLQEKMRIQLRQTYR
jgi:hypothetical protein